MKRFVVALAATASLLVAIICAPHAIAATFYGDVQTFSQGITVAATRAGAALMSIDSAGIVSAPNYRKTNGTTFTTADPNPTRAQLRAASFFLVNTTANAVDLDFSDDADLTSVDIGTDWTFIVSAGGTNALTVTNGASGVVVTTLNNLGLTCEDVSDSIVCTAVALEAVVCRTTCAD